MTITMQPDQNTTSQPPRRAPRYRKHRTLISHLKGVTCLKYSPCGRYLASAGESSVSARLGIGCSWKRSCSDRSRRGSTPMASRVSHCNERTSSLTRFTSSHRSNCLGMQTPGNMYGRTEGMIEVSLGFQLPLALYGAKWQAPWQESTTWHSPLIVFTWPRQGTKGWS